MTTEAVALPEAITAEQAVAELRRIAQEVEQVYYVYAVDASFTLNMRVLSNDRPAMAILDDAAAHGVDLIALATHGRGGLKRLVLGSVADKVLRGAETAVLIYRPVDDAAPTDE